MSTWITGVIALLLVAWPKYLGFTFLGLRLSPYTASMMLVLLALCFYPGARRMTARLLSSYLGWLWCLFLISSMISMVFGSEEASTTSLLREVIQTNSLFLVGALSAARGVIRRDLNILWLSLSVSGSLAIVEKLLERPFVAQWFLSLGASVTSDFLALGEAKFRDGAFRAQATFEHPIMLSSAMGALLILSIWKLFESSRTQNRGGVALALLGAAISLGGSWASGSRTSAIALAVISVVVLLRIILGRYGRAGLVYILYAIVVGNLFYWLYVAIAGESENILLSLVRGRTYEEAMSSELRLIMWQKALYLLDGSPLFGYGPGAEILASVQVGEVTTIDNSYIALMVSRGLIGLFLFLAFFGGAVYSAAVEYFSTTDVGRQELVLLVIGTILSTLAIQFANFIYTGFCIAFFMIGARSVFVTMQTNNGQTTNGP